MDHFMRSVRALISKVSTMIVLSVQAPDPIQWPLAGPREDSTFNGNNFMSFIQVSHAFKYVSLVVMFNLKICIKRKLDFN